jgi:hypothetical protein
MGIASIITFKKQIQVRFGVGVRLPQPICRDLMKTHRRHWFDVDKLSINPTQLSRIISETEDMLDVLEKAFRKAKDMYSQGYFQS